PESKLGTKEMGMQTYWTVGWHLREPTFWRASMHHFCTMGVRLTKIEAFLSPGSSCGGGGPETVAAPASHPNGERLLPRPETSSVADRLDPAPRTSAHL